MHCAIPVEPDTLAVNLQMLGPSASLWSFSQGGLGWLGAALGLCEQRPLRIRGSGCARPPVLVGCA